MGTFAVGCLVALSACQTMPPDGVAMGEPSADAPSAGVAVPLPKEWEIVGGLAEEAEKDDSPIKPVPFDEEEYWRKNAEREGMVVLDSGIQYLPVRAGRGLPIRNAPKVRVNYLVSRITGERVADSRLGNEGRPLEMAVAEMPESWREVLPKMRQGDIWRVFVPRGRLADLDLPTGSYSFDIELVRAFAYVSDWYGGVSEDGGDLPPAETKVSLAAEE